jgi:hypothetical protein
MLDLIAALREPLEKLERRNPAQADQARRAASSAAHNLSEGRRRWRLVHPRSRAQDTRPAR